MKSDLLGAVPVDEWVKEIDEEVEIFVVHPNAKFKTPGDIHEWQGWCRGKWIDFNGGGWTWHGHIGDVTHVRPIDIRMRRALPTHPEGGK